MLTEIYTIALMGSTGDGGYGHRLDTASQGLGNATVVAVSDADPTGLSAAGEKLSVSRLFTDYREMLNQMEPDIAVVCPASVSERVPMITAAPASGYHIYCGKPLAGNLGEVDAILEACEKSGIKTALAHQWRGMPPIQRIISDVSAGNYGKLLRLRALPKDDARGGGEELILHGTHLFDMMIAIAGRPRWASGHITVDGRDATLSDRKEGNSSVGPIAGDSISAVFGFDGGVRGYFDSTAGPTASRAA